MIGGLSLRQCFQDVPSTLITIFISIITYYIFSAIYRLQLDPLSKFPGPPVRAFSRWPRWISYLKGTFPFEVKKLHDQYGHVVRMAPNYIDFGSARAYKDIYGFENCYKNTEKWWPHYDFADLGDGYHTMLTARPADHTRYRRVIGHCFSTNALREQEPIIQFYITMLISQLHKIATSNTEADLLHWYDLAVFDLIGDLSLGQSFGALESGKRHPWISEMKTLFKYGVMTAFTAGSVFWNGMLKLFFVLVPRVSEGRMNHARFTEERGKERLERKTDRKDFISYLVRYEQGDARGMSEDEILRNLSLLIGAGADTTVGLLCGATYFVLANPSAYKRLREELLGAFKSKNEIDEVSVGKLPYLNAVIDEALRLYPPLMESPPRMVLNDCIIDGHFVPKGTVVGCSIYAMGRSKLNFKDADEFRPERWLGAEGFENDIREASQPFSQGPRGCIGMNVALVEAQLILANIFFNFDVELSPESRRWLDVQWAHMGWEKPALNCKLTVRK